MDLALEVGQANLGAFARSLPEQDFRRWIDYASRRGLPSRRFELYLAQIALWVARGAGVENATLDQFLFKPYEKEPDESTAIEDDELGEVKDAMDFRPRKVKGQTNASG